MDTSLLAAGVLLIVAGLGFAAFCLLRLLR